MIGGALDGIRVLDLTRYIPGPYCTMLLGDLGADVVKVEEPPLGDPTRVLPPAVGRQSVVHAALNRNKRSIVVDIRKQEGAAIVQRLAQAVDVFVESFRPSVLKARGLGSEELLSENPRLIYCSLTGYGQTMGEEGARAGHDINYAALAGFLGTNRDTEGRPVLPAAQVADMTGGLVATIGILAALQARERSGRGQLLDVSLLESTLALLTVPAARLLAGGKPGGELTGTYACYNVYRCRDGRYLSLGALEPKFWEALCEALGHRELVGRQWKGGAAAAEGREVLAEIFAQKDRGEWLRELAARDVCVEPILDLEEALQQPRARRAVIEESVRAASFTTVANPVHLAQSPALTRREPPELGEHTQEVLKEAGYPAEEIVRLRESGVVA